jgi:hypothetical protein
VEEEMIKKVGTITITFKKGISNPDGGIIVMNISKDGQTVDLTEEQAKSLAKFITERYGQ